VDTVRYAGSIETSLYEALDRAVPWSSLADEARVQLAWNLADVFAWELDFSRDLQPGDQFQVVLERLTSEEGETRTGNVLAADLEVNGRPLSAFRFAENDKPGYFDAAGRSLRRAFLRAPVEFRRISSRFNRARRHPVLGYARRHEGTDYAAAPGTPVMSAGDGTVVSAGWSGGYGKMVVVRHKNGITTRYGHLRGFAGGVRAGARVSQGQVIGHVGSTGLATGPHLHYEFRVNGVARDPSRVDLGNGAPIAPSLTPAFDADRLLLTNLLLGQPVTAVAAAAVQAASSPVPE
jgi:murein DD-endopeptidase MepM/ murein hydrolase activator NlpD